MLSGAKACKSCRSRQELLNEYLLANFGFDTAENEPLKVCQKIAKVRITVRKNIGEGFQREAVRGGRLRIGDLLSDGPKGDSARARHRVGQLQQGRLRRRLGSVQEGRQSSSRPAQDQAVTRSCGKR